MRIEPNNDSENSNSGFAEVIHSSYLAKAAVSQLISQEFYKVGNAGVKLSP